MKKILDKRAKEQMMDVDELVADIIRRSVLCYKGKGPFGNDKVDDKYLTYFSRKRKKK